jgi:hypothetical protein
MSAETERVFSDTKLTIPNNRSRLGPLIIEALEQPRKPRRLLHISLYRLGCNVCLGAFERDASSPEEKPTYKDLAAQ